MTVANTLLGAITLSSTQASVTFSNIPQTFRDLYLVLNGTTTAGGNVQIQFNGDTGSNYSYVQLYGPGTTAASAAGSGWGSVMYTNPSTAIFHILDYSVSSKIKTILSKSGSAGNLIDVNVDRWTGTAAIASLTISHSGGSYSSGNTFYLYGVLG